MMEGLLVQEALPGSIAAELNIAPGDLIVAVNGAKVRDIVDFQYYADSPCLKLDIIKSNGDHWDVEVDIDEGEPLGIVFSPLTPRQCNNRCLFCFVHQLPRGLRPQLYVKDEDYLLSFLYGNYVTLSSITRDEITRIKEQRLSPLYVSVHATDPALRDQLLGRSRQSVPILDTLQELAAARIAIHTQVVLCPGLNDGEALVKTVLDLAALHPWVASLAVVPVGLTRHRQRLPRLKPVTRAYAKAFLGEWMQRAAKLNRRLHSSFLMFADEFFIKAGLPFPPLSRYGDLVQLENGVGMIPLFLVEANKVVKSARKCPPMRVTVVTGESPYNYLHDFLDRLTDRTGVSFQLIAVKNRLLGDQVTVAGLVAGNDLLAALQAENLGDLILVPDIMLKEKEGVFLDDMTIGDLRERVGVELEVVESTPSGIYEFIKRYIPPEREK